jgi:tRNA-2-methylthio-N6-dimethylallyladenosine synthase
MKRGYTSDDYRLLIEHIRQRLNHSFPGVSIATDVIVGFPGETEEQFMRTYNLLAELKLDVAHLARYSTRPGTVAQRKLVDDISEDEKMRRFKLLEELQEQIVSDINAGYLGKLVDVLFEQQVKGRWKGRTPTNKLVFVESNQSLMGKTLPVQVTWTGPWSMQGISVSPGPQ